MSKLAHSGKNDTDNGSGSATATVAAQICFVGLVSPMKRSFRPIFSILVLVAFAVTIVSRSVVRRSFEELEGNAVEAPSPVVLNETFLRYASVEIGGEKAREEIEQLLEGNFASLGRIRRHPEARTRTAASGSSTRAVPAILRSPRFYRFWVGFRRLLREWSRNRRFRPEVMSDLVKVVSGRRYATCAVVGNSGILLNARHGELIDGHEFVIRLNNARIERFEPNVGSKTSLSFANSNILHLCARRAGCSCHPYGEAVPLLIYICQPLHFLDYTFCNSTHKAPLLVTDPQFDVLCARIVKYYSVKLFVETTGRPMEQWPSTHDGSMFHYSSGMQAVMLALGICDKVSIFGFGKSGSAKHHYHTNQKAELRLHDYEAEYRFYRDLVEDPQVIPFISGTFKFPPVVIYH